ncbi:hypothetical protein BDV96DRAFT_641871 [Lophiotrema nucula]|uniref:Uncharacterized protein n=1 Tax=Lophiotrema nucula TaxID=690887 RepID=A0A6A5ZME7_9PLEO|nr:hypothetical protein BDV96DRAFT_641871 [Lophiotrema nucula]
MDLDFDDKTINEESHLTAGTSHYVTDDAWIRHDNGHAPTHVGSEPSELATEEQEAYAQGEGDTVPELEVASEDMKAQYNGLSLPPNRFEPPPVYIDQKLATEILLNCGVDKDRCVKCGGMLKRSGRARLRHPRYKDCNGECQICEEYHPGLCGLLWASITWWQKKLNGEIGKFSEHMKRHIQYKPTKAIATILVESYRKTHMEPFTERDNVSHQVEGTRMLTTLEELRAYRTERKNYRTGNQRRGDDESRSRRDTKRAVPLHRHWEDDNGSYRGLSPGGQHPRSLYTDNCNRYGEDTRGGYKYNTRRGSGGYENDTFSTYGRRPAATDEMRSQLDAMRRRLDDANVHVAKVNSLNESLQMDLDDANRKIKELRWEQKQSRDWKQNYDHSKNDCASAFATDPGARRGMFSFNGNTRSRSPSSSLMSRMTRTDGTPVRSREEEVREMARRAHEHADNIERTNARLKASLHGYGNANENARK